MNRILFAAARGARLQKYEAEYDSWFDTTYVISKAKQRIHPDDAHLQYGPISTALRKGALTGVIQAARLPYLEGYYKLEPADFALLEENQDDQIQFSMFMLILSEALADEGL